MSDERDHIVWMTAYTANSDGVGYDGYAALIGSQDECEAFIASQEQRQYAMAVWQREAETELLGAEFHLVKPSGPPRPSGHSTDTSGHHEPT